MPTIRGSICNGSKVMTNVNFFIKGHKSGSRSQIKFFCTSGKPLSQGTCMPNIKALKWFKSYDQC